MEKSVMAVKIGNVYVEETPHATLEVGNTLSFKPKFKFKKWSGLAGAVEFSLELDPEEETGTEEYDDVLKKIKWKGPLKKEAEFYPLADGTGYEFNIILLKKHSTGILNLAVTADNVVFYRQGPLTDLIGQYGIVTATDTEGFDAQGQVICRRPENIVNSYAVYHAAPPLNIVGGTVYAAGKICHINRIKAVDKDGAWTWCDMLISGPVMTITIPPAWADTARYPVSVDPTFGYTTVGGTSVNFNAPGSLCHIGAALIFSPASGYNRITKFSIYGSNDGTAGSAGMAAYTIVAGLPVTRLNAAVTITMPAAPAAWHDSAAVAQVLTNGVSYGCAEGAAVHSTVYFDTGAGNQRSSCTEDFPATWTNGGVSAALYSWYATYEQVYVNMMQIQDD